MIDFENFDFKKLDIKKLAEEFKNVGKMLLTAEEVISKAQAGDTEQTIVGLELTYSDRDAIHRHRLARALGFGVTGNQEDGRS